MKCNWHFVYAYQAFLQINSTSIRNRKTNFVKSKLH